MRSTTTVIVVFLVLTTAATALSGQEPPDPAQEYYDRAHAEGISTPERIRWLKQSIAARPTYRAHYDLGKLYRSSGGHAEALKHLESALGLALDDEHRARAAYQLGSTYVELDRYVEARHWLRRCLSYRDNPEVRRALRELELNRRGRVLASREILEEIETERSFGVAKAELWVPFKLNRAELDERGREQAAELGEALTSGLVAAGHWFVLLGHTDRQCPPPRDDAVACDRFNLDLSRRRAATVEQFLVTGFAVPGHQIR
ncbi:MAG: tetratricopeptide repeat protein, partial [bacterium]|nr:tetratricopeptide repeat protein [bacterium]